MKFGKWMAVGAMASLALGLSACGGASSDAEGTKEINNDKLIDSIKADPEVEKLVPESIKKAGILRNGAATDYPPAEFKKEDGQTPTGYEVDTIRALAKVMGLKEATTKHSDFDALIPKVGSEFDLSASAFTITKEREASLNMVSLARVGFQFATAKDNKTFDPKNICGTTIGVQTGTAQQEWLEKASDKCKAEGKKVINIKSQKTQADVTPKVASGQYDAMVADSPVAGYAVLQSHGKIKKVGEVFDTALHGVVIPKKDENLAKAVEIALNKLNKDGVLKKIFTSYGAGDLLLDKSELNPKVDQ